MGREIRRVPPNWVHPTREHIRFKNGRLQYVTEHQPMHERSYAKDAAEWQAECAKWAAGTHENFAKYGADHPFYWEWDGNPPDKDYYVPYDSDALGDDAWYQLYQTVSEGSPISPPFATQQELIDHLATIGDDWDGPWARANAERFVLGTGWAPSMIIQNGQIITARDGGLDALETPTP